MRILLRQGVIQVEIIVRDVNKSYGSKQVLKGVNLTIGSGMYGLLGPNGAGKTTFMRILATLLPASSGEIRIDGVDIGKREMVRGKLGYLPQEFSFYPQLSVYEAMDYLAILSGIQDRRERRRQIVDLLQQVNLWEQRRTKTRALSGGMKRRLGIAQALLNNPELIIVDEPTAGLDPEERVRFRNLLSDLAVNRTVILSTHIVGDIEFACERLAVLNQGTLIYDGKVKDLVQKAEGLVWNLQVERDEMNRIRNEYKVISSVTDRAEIKFRLLSKESPHPDAEQVRPTIEDAYMGLMGGSIR